MFEKNSLEGYVWCKGISWRRAMLPFLCCLTVFLVEAFIKFLSSNFGEVKGSIFVVEINVYLSGATRRIHLKNLSRLEVSSEKGNRAQNQMPWEQNMFNLKLVITCCIVTKSHIPLKNYLRNL